MKKSWRHICLVAASILSVCLSGCSLSNKKAITTLEVSEDGKLTQTIVEPIEENEIDGSELKAYVEESVKEYNSESGSDGISVSSCKTSKKEVRIVLNYESCDDYEAFNQMECFLGTISEAKAEGYSFDATLLDRKDEKAEKTTINERADEWKVLIVEEPMNVKVYDKVLYTTENVEIKGRLKASVNIENEKEAEKGTESVSDQVVVSSSSAVIQPGGTSGEQLTEAQKKILDMTVQNTERAYIIFK